jgi:RHS repeat-associated protein
MLIPGRGYNSEKYRFGFNSKEKDDEWYGSTGTVYDYGFRIYDTRIAKFLSVDPLSSSYPWNSTYAFAMNRVIDGIDLEGLEYLDADEARVEFKYGVLQLKIPNFLWINRKTWKAASSNPNNWTYNPATGEKDLGINKTIGNVSFMKPTQSAEPTSLDNTYGATDPNYNPTQHQVQNPKTKQSNYTQTDKRYKQRTVSGASGMSRGAARGALAINAINFAVEQYMTWAWVYDKGKVESHTLIANQVAADMTKALEMGLIPEEYQNKSSMVNIMNVVLQGAKNTDDESIYKIGMQIYNTISQPYTIITPESPEGADNTRIVKPIVVPKQLIQENE